MDTAEKKMSKHNKDLLLKLRQAYTLSQRRIDNFLKENGITSAQLMFLQYLYEHQDVKTTQNDMANVLMVRHTTVIETYDRLQEKGYVAKEKQGKCNLLHLTPEGLRFMEQMQNRTYEMFLREFRTEDGDLFYALGKLLTRYIDVMKDDPSQD